MKQWREDDNLHSSDGDRHNQKNRKEEGEHGGVTERSATKMAERAYK